MRKLFPAGLFLLSLSAAVSAQTAGFNCAQAATPQEKAICASPELSKADGEMTAAYKAWLTAAPSDRQEEIRQNQRLWLRLRSFTCKEGDTYNPLPKCLLDSEKERTDTLHRMVVSRNGILFVWRALTFTAPDNPEAAADERKNGQRDFGYVDVTWPQAMSSTPEWAAWNKEMTETATHTAGNPAKLWTRKNAVDTDTSTIIALHAVSDSLVSASMESYSYAHGAAHGGAGTLQINWLLHSQRKLESADIFNSHVNWLPQLYDRTDKYLHSKLDEKPGDNYHNFNGAAQTAETLHKLLANPTNWQIDSTGITILFPAYSVACYACTPPPLTMTWEDLKPLLNPAFQIPIATH